MTESELRQSVIDQAYSWLGYDESSGRHKEIIDVYNSIKPLPVGYWLKYTDAWCAGFVSACAWKANLTSIIYPECSCDRMISTYRNHNRWQEDDAYIPNIGDVIFYDWDDNGIGDNIGFSDHVGLVASVKGTMMTIIEGNCNNKVATRNIEVNSRYIRGFGLPDYNSKSDDKTEEIIVESPKESGSFTEQDIWAKLLSEFNAYAAAGIMGNLFYESGLKPNNLENYYETRLGFNDDTYTAAVDNGTYTNFVHDSAGYGLAQWTFYSRKQGLLDYVHSINASIGSGKAQIEFLIKELKSNYSSLYSKLKNTSNYTSAASDFMLDFERPYDTGATAQAVRAEKAKEYFNLYNGKVVQTKQQQKQAKVSQGMTGDDVEKLQIKLSLLGYDVGLSGIDKDFGKDTKSAVESLQRDNGLQVTGQIDDATEKLLDKLLKSQRFPTNIYTTGSSNTEVIIMASFLRYLGYYKGLCFKTCSFAMTTAIKAFQKAHGGLEVDGECGPLTWKALIEEVRNESGI